MTEPGEARLTVGTAHATRLVPLEKTDLGGDGHQTREFHV